jgi:CDP-diacylglycerol--serine O-phosphatidyltransferase
MLRFVDAANLVSLSSLAAAVLCALLAANGRVRYAVIALVISGLCDLFDGAIARRLSRPDDAKRFGQALDLVVDVCAFGMAPAMLLHSMGLRTGLEIMLLIVFVSCAAWRLAYFETAGLVLDHDARYYHGLPTTFVALVVPLACLAGFAGTGPLRTAAAAAAGGLALAMVSALRVRKPMGRVLLIFPVIGAALILTYALVPGYALP